MQCRRALTLLELIAISVVVVALVYLMMARPHRQPLSRRAHCSANLRSIGQGMHIYANDNQDWFPVWADPVTDDRPGGISDVAFVGRLGADADNRVAQNQSHPSRSLFMIVTHGYSTPRQFICPYPDDREDELKINKGARQIAAQPGINRFDFAGYDRLSYGLHLPFGSRARLNQDLDVRVAIMADKGPYFAAGDPRDDGTIPDRHSGVLPPADLTDAKNIRSLGVGAWRAYNSSNHGQDGQNVLYVDDHVSFNKSPLAGLDGDNIYTIQSGPTERDALIGIRPDDKLAPLTDTDSVIVP